MNFNRSYSGHRYLDYLATMYLMDHYRNPRQDSEHQGTSQREANTRENMHDPLLYMAIGYMAAQGDPAMQHLAGLALFSYLVDNKPNNPPGARRNFDFVLERRVVYDGPIHYTRRQNPNYR